MAKSRKKPKGDPKPVNDEQPIELEAIEEKPKKEKDPKPERRKERLLELKSRAGVLRQKFSREVDFETKQEVLNRLNMLADLVQMAIIQVKDEVMPVQLAWLFDKEVNELDQVQGTIKLFLGFGGKKRSRDLQYRAWSNRSDYIFEFRLTKTKTLRKEYPIGEDLEYVKLDLSYEITNKLVELIPS